MIITPRPSPRRVPPLDAHERALIETPPMSDLECDPHPSGWDTVLVLLLLMATLAGVGVALWQIMMSVLA
jgi:hypothetical protein